MKPNPFNILCGGFTFLLALALFGLRGALLSLPSSAVLAADALTPLGLLNFLVLQWFGVRLARRFKRVLVNETPITLHIVRSPSNVGLSLDGSAKVERRPDGFLLLRWIWPLTGWWTDYRWIARKS